MSIKFKSILSTCSSVHMDHHFEAGREFARKLDEEDELSEFRERFYIPEGKIYMDGNSLGLLSKDSEKSVERVLDEWKNRAIDGWTKGEKPWFYMAERLGDMAAPLVGAKEEEVVATGTTTVNIHSLISTFYEPRGKRTKILADELNFPTDIYALKGQIEMKGLDREEHLVLVPSEDGDILDEEKIIEMMTEEIDVALLPSVLYRSAQLLDMEYLTKKAHENGIKIGFDCSHSVGCVPHHFDEWDVDFAMWCSYKYLNGGPGSTAFLYINEKHFDREPLLKGWFGYIKEKQFDMNLDFQHSRSAGGWQISSPAIINTAPLEGSLEITRETGIENIREKSKKLTSYLVYLADEILSEEPYSFYIRSPRDPDKRSGHIALARDEEAFRITKALKGRGVVPDFRPPNIIRLAPIALYNSYEEIWKVVQHLKEIIDEKEYENFSEEKDAIT